VFFFSVFDPKMAYTGFGYLLIDQLCNDSATGHSHRISTHRDRLFLRGERKYLFKSNRRKICDVLLALSTPFLLTGSILAGFSLFAPPKPAIIFDVLFTISFVCQWIYFIFFLIEDRKKYFLTSIGCFPIGVLFHIAFLMMIPIHYLDNCSLAWLFPNRYC
jgi:hypothetical protein